MNDATLVGVMHRRADPLQQPQPEPQLVTVERGPVTLDVDVERVAFHQLHRQVRVPVLAGAGVEDRCDVRMPQAREGLDLPPEHRAGALPGEGASPDHLERHAATRAVLLRLQDDAHAALAEDSQDAIPGDARELRRILGGLDGRAPGDRLVVDRGVESGFLVRTGQAGSARTSILAHSHLAAGSVPVVRVAGRLEKTAQKKPGSENVQALIYEILTDEQIRRFEKEGFRYNVN